MISFNSLPFPHLTEVMPIQCSLQLQDITDEDFSSIDEAVMRCAYASQNHFGRLFDERVYENDIAARLRREGFEVYTQVPIKVTHGDFEKIYVLDLIVNQMLYEVSRGTLAVLLQQ